MSDFFFLCTHLLHIHIIIYFQRACVWHCWIFYLSPRINSTRIEKESRVNASDSGKNVNSLLFTHLYENVLYILLLIRDFLTNFFFLFCFLFVFVFLFFLFIFVASYSMQMAFCACNVNMRVKFFFWIIDSWCIIWSELERKRDHKRII